MISYRPLMITLAKKGLKKTDLLKGADISGPTLAKFSKNEYVKLEVIDRICDYLDCSIEDILMHIKGDNLD